MTLEEVMHRYNLSLEEFYSWQHAMDKAGVRGLRVAWSQQDRLQRRRSERRAHELVAA